MCIGYHLRIHEVSREFRLRTVRWRIVYARYWNRYQPSSSLSYLTFPLPLSLSPFFCSFSFIVLFESDTHEGESKISCMASLERPLLCCMHFLNIIFNFSSYLCEAKTSVGLVNYVEKNIYEWVSAVGWSLHYCGKELKKSGTVRHLLFFYEMWSDKDNLRILQVLQFFAFVSWFSCVSFFITPICSAGLGGCTHEEMKDDPRLFCRLFVECQWHFSEF